MNGEPSTLVVHVPRFVPQYGFWEFFTEPARLVRKTHKGNLVVRFANPVGWLSERIYDKVTGICVSKCGRKHVPEKYKRWKVTGL